MACPTCGQTSACDSCIASKESIREAARQGRAVLRIRSGHVALHGNSAAFCGARGLPLSDEACSIHSIPAFACPQCVSRVDEKVGRK